MRCRNPRTDPIPWPYDQPGWHREVSSIIRGHSSNPVDVREVALAGLELASVETVLDLGCGFGFMAEALAHRVAPGARVVGVDGSLGNGPAYCAVVQATGRQAAFRQLRLATALPWAAGSFDLVVASYSLYFFPELLPEVARVLRPTGLFLVLTHAEAAAHSLVALLGARGAAAQFPALVACCSAESGRARLSRAFAEVERIEYPNELRFTPDSLELLLTYLRFKLPLLLAPLPAAPAERDLPDWLVEEVRHRMARQGEIRFCKDDAAFRCRRPRCP